MNRSRKVQILSQLLAGQPSSLLQLKRIQQPVTSEFTHLTNEELDQQIAELEAEMIAAGIEKTVEDIALDAQIAELELRINS